MTCEVIREQFAMLLYGELSFDEEEKVESHLDVCAECRSALAKEKARHAAMDSVEIEPSPSLLMESRQDLFARLKDEDPPRETASGWWRQFADMFHQRPITVVLRPVGALALLAVGFLGARVLPIMSTSMGLVQPSSSRVRYVEPAANGRVQIVLDETRQRVISGRLEDQEIRALLLGAAKDPSDPGLRAETVGILNGGAQSADVRDALVYALRHDQNAGVRMRAMGGLTPFAQEPEVRTALSQVLLSDENPGLRTQAIDLLTAGSTNGSGIGMDRQVIGTLQELMQRGEQQGYVRDQSRRILEAVKASVETY